MKKLAICVPTFNRSNLLNRLLKSIPSSSDIIVSICDDGSDDNTHQIVENHKSRFSIKYMFQKNQGRASALRKSILNIKAQFMLMMGDDDYFTKNGINMILNSIKNNKNNKFFVFSTKIKDKKGVSSESLEGIPIINYLSLRPDFKISRDLKEVIDHDLICKAMYKNPKNIRRIPTGFLLYKVSEKVDCMPVKSAPVIVIEYFSDGMSANVLPLKVKYPEYMVKMYKIALKNKKYKSLFFRLKYLILFYRYSFHNNDLKLLNLRHIPFLILGIITALFDMLIIFIFH